MEHGLKMKMKNGYGLGRYCDLKGDLKSYGEEYISDDNWLDGFSKSEPAIIVNSNTYSQYVAGIGNSIRFKNGECCQIIDVVDDGANIIIRLNSDRLLSTARNGSLDEVTFIDGNGHELPKSRVGAYRSSYGLQGKIFRHLARYMDHDEAINNLNLICSIATAFVFAIIVILLQKKYNVILAGCFLVTFWLSPWIVNFARNLYWVEYTWFILMAVGLFCAWKINNRKCRIASYILTFLAIMGKCLCGYEYISVIMMGLIAFLLVDLAVAVIRKDTKESLLLYIR